MVLFQHQRRTCAGGPAESAAPSRWSRFGTAGLACGDAESATPCPPPSAAQCAAPPFLALSRTVSGAVVTLMWCDVEVDTVNFTLRRCAATAGVVNGRNFGFRTTP